MWYDGSAGLGRLDYWGGVDRYIYNSSGIGYQIVPTTSDGLKSDETCFTTGESGEVDNLIFPDLTYFPEEPDESTTVIDGEECESWTLQSPTFNDTTVRIFTCLCFSDPLADQPLDLTLYIPCRASTATTRFT